MVSMLMSYPLCAFRASRTARAILRSAEPDAHGRVGFAAFCNAMLPADVDTSIAVKVPKGGELIGTCSSSRRSRRRWSPV